MVIGLDPAGSMDTFGFLGLVGADPPRTPELAPVVMGALDKLGDDDEIAFVTLGVAGIRLVLPLGWSPLVPNGEFLLESFLGLGPPSPFEDTSARPLIFRFSAVFRSDAS